MSDKPNPPETKDEPKAVAKKPALVRLKHAEAWSGTLSCGETNYTVKGGVVEVAEEHVAQAAQAGFGA